MTMRCWLCLGFFIYYILLYTKILNKFRVQQSVTLYCVLESNHRIKVLTILYCVYIYLLANAFFPPVNSQHEISWIWFFFIFGSHCGHAKAKCSEKKTRNEILDSGQRWRWWILCVAQALLNYMYTQFGYALWRWYATCNWCWLHFCCKVDVVRIAFPLINILLCFLFAGISALCSLYTLSVFAMYYYCI